VGRAAPGQAQHACFSSTVFGEEVECRTWTAPAEEV
jgi:hypothetical protein